MKLLNLNKYFYLFIFILILINPLSAEDAVDIWKKKKVEEKKQDIPLGSQIDENNKETKIKFDKVDSSLGNIKITEDFEKNETVKPIYGIFDPEENNFSLNMWSETDGNEIKNAFKRINNINLSNSAEEIFVNTIMTYSYLPAKNISEKEFLNLKIDWLIENQKDSILEKFLIKNNDFSRKKKIIQYLVDKNLAKANLSEGCSKAEFIGKDIKDSYLEKFKIYCLIFNNKKGEAQLLFDILKEQKLSNKIFNNRINFLLGITDKAETKIQDNNLLNFYLASITIPNFSYEPSEKTNKYIWEYLNAANLVEIKDLEDKEKIRTFEIAANKNTLDKSKIFEIYKKIEFDLNTLIKAEETYQSLDSIESRALIYQKFLLSDNVDNKIKYLFLLKDLFKKDNLSNVFTKFMSDRLEEIKPSDIPSEFDDLVKKNIFSDEEYKLGKIKFDDKIFHKSKVLKFYTQPGASIQKSQKDLNNVLKKIKKNKKYFFSVKDLALLESLEMDGFNIPKEIDHKNISKQYDIPQGLMSLVKKREIGLLALKFVEIIGEDEISDLDPESIYFITNLLNEAKLIKFRKKVLIASLPLRE